MKKLYKIESYIPVFPGFYNTGFDIFEYMDEEDNEKLDNGEVEIDYASFNKDASIILAEITESILKDNGINLKVIPQGISSPKYYNYSNDCANCMYEVEEDVVWKIFSILNDNYESFNDYLKNKYTSCDGFISSYSNKINDWLVFNDVVESGHMFGSILEFLFIEVFHVGQDDMMYDFIDDMYYYEYLVDVNEDKEKE